MNADTSSQRDALHRFHVLPAPIELVHREPTQLLGYRSLVISKEIPRYNANPTSGEHPPFQPPHPLLSLARRNKSRVYLY
mgnify:CR=1 FL=1